MSVKPNLNRRDFLKLGGLAAVALPTITKVGTVGEELLLESPEAYGGFVVRTLADDDPAIKVDEDIYERFDSTNVIFSRIMWDEEYIEKVNSTEKVFNVGDSGYTHIDAALSDAAVFCGTYDGTNSPMTGSHAGLLGLNPSAMSKPGISFDGRWDHSRFSPEEVAAVVKKAALFLGASLVGIAPMNERWIYSHYYDAIGGGGQVPIEFTEVEEVELPEGQLSPQDAGELIKTEMEKMDGDQIKAMIIDVLENTDPAQMPAGAPPVGMVKMLPASQFKENLSMFTSMPTPVLSIFADKLGFDFEIANVDPGESARPRYLEDGTLAIPETMKTVIVLAFEMDYDSIEAAPTVLGDAGTMDGYSKMAITAGSLAQFIRGLGYNAIPCGNNTGISVPQAIEAGLGEGGRNGILITPKYGPRVRLAKVITDLPMAYDKPIRFGVEEFCEVCKKCATHCPTQAISYGPKTMEPTTISTNPGVLKWSVNAEDCYLGWTANASGCGMCIRVCPFNKPEGWLHEATRIMIGAQSGALDQILVKLDDASGYGTKDPKFKFWESDNFIHIKDISL
ncbi:MAG: reductive dehalogenase [Ardenticatenaceae bacterium]|nr:reductive dehalogenase [Ardenticatenaceae bacterium]